MQKSKHNIALVCGARPNFMKVAPLCRSFEREGINYFLVNTGQHYDSNMSEDFFREFDITPHYTYSPNRESSVQQFTDIMLALEETFLKEKPDLVVVVGDVNSTLAGGLVAKKLGIPLAHVEAGLRSYNKKMPEEMNRVLTDNISDLLFITIEEGVDNLAKENIRDNIHFVGNIMIDTLAGFADGVSDMKEDFYFSTLHRPENIDDPEVFSEILDALEEIAKDHPIYLPLHPRTKKMAEEFGFSDRVNSIFKILPPLSYGDTLKYQKNAKLILTDSGGIQEEACFWGTPCLTLRTETERPVTVTHGTNTIAGVTKKSILDMYKKKSLGKQSSTIALWDGKTADRIVAIIKETL